ncbi:MAG: DUF2974 domain-containing protein [Sphaerochaetaceae bacterium]|nr:DUF2974 domain-containing protein [Sphaerochaetaceae bacterium]
MAKENKEKIFSILDYVDWRGDISPAALPYNEVDFVIFSELVYSPLENIRPEQKGSQLKTLFRTVYPEDLTDRDGFLRKTRFDLWKRVPESPRFGEVRLMDFESNFEPENSKQFAAALFSFEDKDGEAAVISYRGTDSTIIGWKEDLMLSFEVPVPAQSDALKFLEKAFQKYERVYLCGHSKGGNLAKYSAAYCSQPEKVPAVYDFDGPGLDEASVKGERWQEVRKKVISVIPESSVIGLLLTRGTDNMIVRSENVSFMQHNPFYWHVKRGSFLQAGGTTISSRTIELALSRFLESLPNERRKKLVMTIFGLLEASGATHLRDLPSCVAKNFGEVSRMYREVPEQDKEALKEIYGIFKKVSGDSIKTVFEQIQEENRKTEV